MEPVPEEMTQPDLDETRGPSRVLMVLGVLVALMLALAGAAVLYSSIEPQNRAADTRSISVAQLQPAETETLEDANARAAADRVLAESLTRQASQTQAALAAAESNVGLAPSVPVSLPAPAPASETPPPAATQVAALPPSSVVETPPVDALPTATVPLPAPAAAAAAPAANLPAAPRPLVQEAVKPPDPEKIGAPAAPLAPAPSAAPAASATPAAPAAPAAPFAPAAPSPTVSTTPEEANRMLTRASVMIQQGDIASARLMLDRLVRANDGRAMYLLAETFDPKMLVQWNVRGIKPDTARARALYGEAIKAGISEARDRLIALGN